MSEDKSLVTENVWRVLRQFTDARIGLGRAGVSLPTRELLEFQLAHARAIDAVHFPLDAYRLEQDLLDLPMALPDHSPVRLSSQVEDRPTYLQRPDLGRFLSEVSRQRLERFAASGANTNPHTLAIVIVDGLSSSAVQNNAVPMVSQLLADLQQVQESWQLAPVMIVEQGRVAVGDQIGECLGVSAVVVLIGERPGLSSPDSLGIYFTWKPETGLTDARRNCISNVRPDGLSFAQASQRLIYLMREAKKLGISGVSLKDRTDEVAIEDKAGRNFLTE